jgi:membrane protein
MKLLSVAVPERWSVIGRRTYAEVLDDHCLGLAAELAFYFLLALFPALLFLVALVSVMPVEHVLDQWFTTIQPFAPPEVLPLIRGQLDELAGGGHSGLLTIGLVGAIWSSSAAMTAIISTLNRAYDLTESRPWWKARLLAVVLTIAFAVFLVTASVLLLAGRPLFEWMGGWIGWSSAAVTAWTYLRWPFIAFTVVLAIDLIYHFAPNRRVEWVWLTPGSLLATALWFGASLGFKTYTATVGGFNATYGAIGTVVVLMLWLYLSGLALLIGAELNAEIEREFRERRSGPEGCGPVALTQ